MANGWIWICFSFGPAWAQRERLHTRLHTGCRMSAPVYLPCTSLMPFWRFLRLLRDLKSTTCAFAAGLMVRSPPPLPKVLLIQLPLRRCKFKRALNRGGFGLKLASKLEAKMRPSRDRDGLCRFQIQMDFDFPRRIEAASKSFPSFGVGFDSHRPLHKA